MAKEFSVFVNIGGRLAGSLPAAVASAESLLARLGKRVTALNAGTASAFTRAAQGLDAAGKRIGDAGRTAAARISTPAGLLGLGAGKLAFDFEKAGNMLEALGDATADQRKEFEGLANELNKKYPQTLAGIIKTGNEMLKGGFSFDQMRGAIDQTLATAVLGEMEPAEVGNMMARTINSFQLPMKTYQEAMRSSQRVSDQMTFAAVKTTASLKDMGEMYRYVGGASSAAGISLEQASAFAMAFAKNGSVGSDAGVALRSAIVRMVKMPPKALAALERTGMKLGDYVGGGRKLTADGVLSGLQADGIDASPVKKQIAAALNDKKLAASPVKLSAEITKLVQGAMKNAGSALDASTIAQSVQDSITAAGSKIDLVKFFVDLKKKFDKGEATLGDVATILEGRHVSRYMALLQSDLPALIRSVQTESDGYAQARYGIVLKGIVGPVYEFGAAIEKLSVALGRAAFPTLAKGISAVADGINKLSESNPTLMKFIAAVGLGAIALGPFLIAAGATVRVVGLLVRGLGLLGTAATLGLATRLVAVASGIKAIAVASTLAAVGRLRALAAGIIALGAVGGSKAVLAAMAGSIAMLGRAILALPLVMLKGALVGIAALFSPIGIAVTAVTTALAALGLWVYNNLSGLGTFFTSFGDAFMKALGPEASQNLTTVVGWLKQAWQWVNNLLGPIDETGKKWASWGTAAGSAAGAIVTALTGLPEKIGGLAKQGYDALVNFDWAAAGRTLVEKIASGITGAAGALAGALKGAVSGAWESAKGAIGLGSSPAAPKPGAPATSAPGAPAIAGARALGGPVSAGLPYLVGERGPEIFVPSSAGRIETNGVLNSIAKAGGRATGSGGLTVGVDATAVERAGETAKAAGAQLHAALDATRKPIVNTSSIDAATAAAERLKAVLATVGAGNISVGGGTAAVGDSSGGGGTAGGEVGRAARGGSAGAVGAVLGRSGGSAAAGMGGTAPSAADQVGNDSVTVNGHRYRAGAGSEEGRQRVASWLGFLRRPTEAGGLGLEADKSRAMVAMLQGESHANLNPGALGDHRNGKPTAFGTAQWRLDRAAALRATAAGMGRHWSDVEAQQAHFRNEMLGRYRSVYDAVRAAPSGEHALAVGIDRYENPAKKALAYRFRRPYLDTLRRQEAQAEAAKPAAAAVKPAPAATAAGKDAASVPGTIISKGVEVGKLAGARATGGPVSRGLSYLVGERGPEVFTPGASGAISTNGALARLTDLGSRMTPAEEGGRSPSLAPSPKVVAELRPQGGNISTRGDTHYSPSFHIHEARDPQAVQREVSTKFFDLIRQHESDQRGLLSD